MQAIIDCRAVAHAISLNTGKMNTSYVATLKIPKYNGGENTVEYFADESRLKALAMINRYAVQAGFAINNRDARTLYRNIDK